MPEIRSILEFQGVNSGARTVPAGELDEYEFYSDPGWDLVSWGVTSLDNTVRLQTATITPGNDGVLRFVGRVHNTDTVSHSHRWTFVVVKK
ncbi:hypothetical protein [Amycolatopsis sp. TNS106]|uniref:hypothetical protein n=1 Tax=Amycolatopsis sp. TNS106 TaxID=2861750 RepID=UPI001C577E29|nr:hypothetical protein [Amycolatopsis sp. TNS106]QXV62051.1 hypothetical protein CVV72_37045 [Amycolatopsis sp. TNS106]